MSRSPHLGRRTAPTPSVILLSLVAGTMLAACAAVDQDERLGLVCQFQKCDCVSDTLIFADTRPVEWRQDGTAACAEGYHLRKL